MSIRIELRSGNGIKHAIQALREGDYAGEQSISICFHTPFFSTLLDDDVNRDLKEMMELLPPRLTFLGMKPIVDNEHYLNSIWKCLVPVEAVARAIMRAQALDEIEIDQLVIVGLKEKFQELADSIRGHPALKHALLNCESREGYAPAVCNIDEKCDTTSYLDPAINALGSLKTMEMVRLTDRRVNIFKPTISSDALLSICGLSKLKTLTFFSFCLTDKQLITMAKWLRDKASLTALNIQCRKLGKDGSDALRGVVQELVGGKCTTLYLTVPAAICLGVMEHIREMMRRNYTMEAVYLRKCVRPDRSNFYHHLNCNEDEIDFLAKTNKLGRGQLFRQGNEGSDGSATWLKMLNATDFDLTNIFYLVKSNPLKFVHILQNDWAQRQIPDSATMTKLLEENNKTIMKELRKVVQEAIGQSEGTKRALQEAVEDQPRPKKRTNTGWFSWFASSS